MELIHYIFFTIIVLFLYKAISRFTQKKISMRTLFFWMFILSMAAFVVYKPEIIQTSADYLGIGRGSDLLLYLSMFFVFYFLFNLKVEVDNIDQKITKLGRTIGIKNAIEKSDEENIL